MTAHGDQLDCALDAAYHAKELKELLHDNWPLVHRHGKHLDRMAMLTPHYFLGVIAHELCLQHRDHHVLGAVLDECRDPGTDHVNLTMLRDLVARHGIAAPYAAALMSQGSPRKQKAHVIRAANPELQLILPSASSPRAATAATTGDPAFPSPRRGGRRVPVAPPGPSAPPYAVKGDHILTNELHRRGLAAKKEAFREAMANHCGTDGMISRSAFFKAINSVDTNGISHREAQALFTVLDPKRTGFVSMTEFCDRFTFEFLKPKSMRSTMGATNVDGATNVFEWQAAMPPPLDESLAAAAAMAALSPGRGAPGSGSADVRRDHVAHHGKGDTDSQGASARTSCAAPRATKASELRRTVMSARQASEVRPRWPVAAAAQESNTNTSLPPAWKSSSSSHSPRALAASMDGSASRRHASPSQAATALPLALFLPAPPTFHRVRTKIVPSAAALGNVPSL